MATLIGTGDTSYSYRTWLPTSEQAPVMTREQFDTLSMQTYRKVNQSNVGMSPWEVTGRYIAGVGLDTADTFWSTPLNPFGERGDVWSLASDEERNYMEANRPLIEGSSAVAGGVLTLVASEALLIPRMGAGLASSTALTSSRLYTAARGWSVASRTKMLAAQRFAAESGETFSLLSNPAGRAFMANRLTVGAAVASRTVPMEYAVMWNNESFNSGDWEREGFWIGVGAVTGGVVGGIGGRSLVRKIANSQEMRDLRAAPLALAGVSNDLLGPEHLELAKRINAAGPLQMKESAYTTEFLIASRSANPNGMSEAAANASRLHKIRDEHLAYAEDSVQKIVQKGISGMEVERKALKELPEIRALVQETGQSDPFVLHGLAEMGLIKGTLDDALESRAKHIKSLELQSQVMAKKGNSVESGRLARTARVLEEQEGFALVNGSWYDPKSPLGKAALEYDAEYVQGRLILSSKSTEAVYASTPSGRIAIDALLNPSVAGKNIDPASLPIKDRLILNEAASTLVRKMSAPSQQARFSLTDESAENWYSLDLAAELLDRNGPIQFNMKKDPLRSIDDIRRQSLRLKARALLDRVGPTGRITPELRFRYNLPMPTPMEMLEDSAGDGFRQWLIGASKDEGTYKELAQALSDYRTVAGLDLMLPAGSPLKRTDGDMLGFNRSQKTGKWLKPLLGYFDRRNRIEGILQRGHANALTLRKAEKTALLLSNQTHVAGLANDLAAMPEITQAMNIQGLAADQITGLGGGVGQLAGELLPRRFRYRDNPALLAATKLQERTERHGLATFRQMVDASTIQQDITRITSAGGATERAMLDQYFTLRSGWDISGAVPDADGWIRFTLSDTKGNRQRMGIAEDQPWDTARTYLMNEQTGKPIVVNADAFGTIQKFNKLTSQLRDADNALRTAKGLSPIDNKPFYTPPPQTRGALVGFVFGPDNKLIPGRTIVARSVEEYNTLTRKTLKDLGPNSGHTIRSREQLESLRDEWDEAQMDWIDPGIHAATANLGKQTGGLTGQYVKQGAFTEALDWVKRKTIAQSQDTLRQMMHETLLVSRANGAAERSLVPDRTRTIFDEFEMALTGRSQNYSETSIADNILRKAEEGINKVLAHSSIVTPARYVIDTAQRIGMDPTDLSGKRTYREIAKAMGEYTPFKTATDFLESRGIRRPPTVRGMASSLNTLSASVLLRWFEVPHAAMNLLGLMATMPAAVVAAKAPVSTFINVKGKSIGLLDGTKVIAGAMQDMFSKAKNADWVHMNRMGDAGQSVMEYHQNLAAIDSQAGFMKWAKQIDKWVSIGTDTTENWSRQFAHFVGLRMADMQGIQGMAARHDFAREIANAAIADYAPINRPELFASGFGSMLGLFQSYGLNQYTKMFRWIEEGQYGKAGLQAGLQATMFGLPGTYGLGHLLDLRDSTVASGSEPTAIDLIYQHYGPVLGGAIAHGGVSELTQLALWTRGDMNFRVPALSGSLPAFDIGTKVARGFVDAVQSYMNAMPGEGLHAMMEVVQREMPNRVLRSWLTILNGGKEIDAYGQVMAETRNWMDFAARTIGVRSRRQQAELEAYYASKSAMERDAVGMERLRESFRTAVRNNSGNPEAVNPIQYFNDYVKNGGNPHMFRTWVRNLMRDSDNSRAAKQLSKSLSTARTALETWRYPAYGAWDVE